MSRGDGDLDDSQPRHRHPDDRKAAARLLRAPIRARFWREWAERGRREEISCACLSVSPAMSRHQLHMPVGVITAPSMYFGSISGHARRSIHQLIEILNTQCPAGEMFYAVSSRGHVLHFRPGTYFTLSVRFLGFGTSFLSS